MNKLSPKKFDFTKRQTQIAALVAKGTPRKIMCAKLGIKMPTLARHLEIIRAKLHVGTIYEAGCCLAYYF